MESSSTPETGAAPRARRGQTGKSSGVVDITSTQIREVHPGAWLVCALGFAAALAIMARFAAGYFFLFDDFSLVAFSKRETLATLLQTSGIGFYRPAAFVVLWAGARVFDWDVPAGFITVSLTIHALNALLCASLARALALDRLTAALAGLLFLFSPWGTEAFLWLSGTFDVVATCGVLGALLCVRRLMIDRPRRLPVRALLIAGVLAFTTLACFAKESGVVLPALALASVVIVPPPRRLYATAAVALVAVTIPALAYLYIRARTVGMLSGAYGDFGALVSSAQIGEHLWSYARHYLLPPAPTDVSTTTMVYRLAAAYPYLGAILPAALWRGARDRSRILMASAVGILICLAPVMWTGLQANRTVSSRFAYQGGVWVALATAAALGALLAALRRLPGSAPVPAAVVLLMSCGYYGGSLWYQARLWQTAAAVSRSVMAQMEAYRGGTATALYIVNMPYAGVEGPWIMKAYAFRLYREGRAMPAVRADGWLLRLSGSGPAQAVSPLGPDMFSDYQADGRPETRVTLRLDPTVTSH